MIEKILVNGFFRSGTTYIYKVLKNNSSIPIFYEPLNINLESAVFSNLGTNLHSANLWDDYRSVEDLSNILNQNPGLNSILDHNTLDVEIYFNLLSRDYKKTIFQTNRAHLWDKNFINSYFTDSLHIIRHPDEVYKSFKKGMAGVHKSNVKNYMSKLYHKFINDNPFELNDMFSELPFESESDLRKRFIITWVYTNYKAVNNYNRYLTYDNFDKIGSETFVFLDAECGGIIDTSDFCHFFNFNARKEFESYSLNVSKEYGIEKEARFLFNLFN